MCEHSCRLICVNTGVDCICVDTDVDCTCVNAGVDSGCVDDTGKDSRFKVCLLAMYCLDILGICNGAYTEGNYVRQDRTV